MDALSRYDQFWPELMDRDGMARETRGHWLFVLNSGRPEGSYKVARIGMFCLPMQSHMNLFLRLADLLRERGHNTIFFGIPMNAARIRGKGFEFHLLEPDVALSGTLDRMVHELGTLNNSEAMRFLARLEELRYEGILKKGPGMVKQTELDAMLVDQAEACGGSVAELAGLPWVSICNGLPLNSEPQVPPFFTAWSYNKSWPAVVRNTIAYAGLRLASNSIKKKINGYRKLWRLEPLRSLEQTFSPFAQISQQVREFDFPRRNLPQSFHYVGPIGQPSTKRPVDFRWNRLDGRPLVYASLGTIMNQNERIYRTIIDACSGIDVQLVLSLGGGGNVEAYQGLSLNSIVVDFAPQRELLQRAAIAITHGGLNSTLESLGEGVPLVGIPITFDQPGVAARIRWTGAGEFIPSSQISSIRLRTTVQRVLQVPSYREAARRMRHALTGSDGAHKAVRIIEEVIRTGRPVVFPPQEPISKDAMPG